MAAQSKAAFTLIELSIVLVIIGLLAAGILVGRDLIRAAEIRKQVAQIETLNTSVNAFRIKYDCLPGDCPKAQDLGLGTNGNGMGYYGNPSSLDDEPSINFWQHLSRAQMIAGNYPGYDGVGLGSNMPGIATPALALPGSGNTASPPNAYPNLVNPQGGIYIIEAPRLSFQGPAGRYLWFLTASTGVGNAVGVYAADDMYAIDIKIDDGFPNSGTMQAASGQYNLFINRDYSIANAFPDACIDDSPLPANPAVYNIQNSNISSVTSLCAPVIKASF